MSRARLRFLHTSDWHLERPAMGLAEIPESLEAALIEAPYRAATSVVDAALAEEVDFVVASGDLIDPLTCGSRGLLFLIRQFERLAERGIAVYWAAGAVDGCDGWPAVLPLPSNVHRFGRFEPTEIVHRRDGREAAVLVGRDRAGRQRLRGEEFLPSRGDLPVIVVAHGTFEEDPIASPGVDVWALGGEHARGTLEGERGVMHYPGTVQGRSPQETGPHGCTLVEIDEERRIDLLPIETDALRWQQELIAVGPQVRRSELEDLFRQRCAALREQGAGRAWIVHWTLAGSGPLLAASQRFLPAAELLGWLRQEFFHQEPPGAMPPIWSGEVRLEPDDVPRAAEYPPDTLIGDYLRVLDDWVAVGRELLDPSVFLSQRQLAGALPDWVHTPDHAARARIAREAALLGGRLLGAEEPLR